MAKSKSKKKFKLNKKIAIGLLGILTLPLFLIAIIVISFNGKIFPNTYVAGIYLGDKTKEEAASILNSSVKIPTTVEVYANGADYKIDTSEIGLSFDAAKSAERAYLYSSSGNLLGDIRRKILLIARPENVGLYLNYDDNKLTETLDIISSEIGTPPVYPSVEKVNGEIVVNNGKNGVEVDVQKTKEEILNKLSLLNTTKTQINLKNLDVELSQEEGQKVHDRAVNLVGKKIVLNFEDSTFQIPENTLLSFLNYGNTYDENQINEYIKTLSQDVNRPAQNSVFVVENEAVKEFVPSKDGVTIDEESLKSSIVEALGKIENNFEESDSQSIKIPVNLTKAEIKNEDVNNLGINSLLGKGVSYFRGSIPNRVYNINHAASKFKGILVAPGDTFSFNEILGDVSALTGYKSAYVIKDGRTVLGDGGGVCQVSTTMFRAALKAGLPITERRAHSYRVGYYEQGFPVGLDATVYYPTTDLKFVNNTPAYILIQSEIDIPHSTLVFEIYGTDDGRVASTTKPIITSSTAPPEDLYIDDPTLPAGTVKQIDYKSWGAKVVFDYTVTRNGETLTDKTFYSNYQPWQAVFLRGTGGVQ